MDNYSNLLMDECPPDLRSPEDESKPPMKKSTTKGVATSFGFRKQRPQTAGSVLSSNNPTAARRLANASTESVDNNGNGGHNNSDTAPLTTNAVPTARSAAPHRLPPPKKEAQATTKISRFGFRQPNANRLNRVADANTMPPPTRIEFSNNNVSADTKEREKIESEIKAKVEMHRQLVTVVNTTTTVMDSNRNRPPLGGKYTLHTNQLPRPQPIKLLESKQAKTLANNNRKQNVRPMTTAASGDDSSTFTEDSGVGSNGEIPKLDKSPMSRRGVGIAGGLPIRKQPKARNLDVVLTGNKFDVRDVDETESVAHTQPLMPLPPLPTLTTREQQHLQLQQRLPASLGFVRDRAMEYQRNVIDKQENRMRRTSLTSSEASATYEEDKPYKRNEKIAKFIKQKTPAPREASSSDEQMWSSHAGETMADEISSSFCTSSSDESRGKPSEEVSIASLITAKAQNRLSLVDPHFAAIAASSISAPLIEDEPSPADSIVCSFSDTNESLALPDNDKKPGNVTLTPTTSNSKELNEKNSTSSPGSPTNASNSLSLSDGRDDFLIDDEIADQPALLCDDTITNSTQASETTPTVVDSTPKQARRMVAPVAYENSPVSLRSRKLFHPASTASLDTLSPCESIASDDCIMDYDLSSGVEDANDRTETNSHYSLDDVQVKSEHVSVGDIKYIRDWSKLLAIRDYDRDSSKRLSLRSSRMLKSRGCTPASSLPDSPRSELLKKSSASPLRLSSSRSSTGTGYDSDDSAAVRLDYSQYCALQQDVMGVKTMLLRLRRVLHEPATEDYVLKSETRSSLNENGFFNGFGSDGDLDSEEQQQHEEVENLRRQVVFLQGQLEDAERANLHLREEMVQLAVKNEASQSAPASVVPDTSTTCNAATQTERIRPISAGPSLLQGAATNDLSPGSLVSVSEQNNNNQTPPPSGPRRSRHGTSTGSSPGHHQSTPAKGGGSNNIPSRLWRMPGEPPSPSAIPRRSCSRTRVAPSSLTTTSTASTT